MPNRNKQLGTSTEHAIVEKAKASGLRARRQPLSGVLEDFPNDVEIEQTLVEAKVRSTKLSAKGARMLSIDLEWLKGVEAHAAKAGYEHAVVVVRPKGSHRLLLLTDLDDYLSLLKAAKHGTA